MRDYLKVEEKRYLRFLLPGLAEPRARAEPVAVQTTSHGHASVPANTHSKQTQIHRLCSKKRVQVCLTKMILCTALKILYLLLQIIDVATFLTVFPWPDCDVKYSERLHFFFFKGEKR